MFVRPNGPGDSWRSADRVEALLADVMAAYALTAVLVTHDAARARRLGTRGLRLEEGRSVATGPIDEVVG